MRNLSGLIQRKSFSRISRVLDIPDLLSIQLDSFNEFLQLDKKTEERENIGLEQAFRTIFPIEDSHNTFALDYVSYSIGKPRYSEKECLERGISYAAPLKAKLILKIAEEDAEPGVYPRVLNRKFFWAIFPL